jgi:hypothetical protein
MATANAVTNAESTPITQTESGASRTRLLRWSYGRDGELLTCSLSLTPDHTAYELRVSPPLFTASGPSELFDDAIAAFEQQAALERLLLSDGWHLEHFEHQR